MIIYDIGLAGGDVDLANSLWRRFFLMTDKPDPVKIELLVKYVRKTVASLDQMKLDDLFTMQLGSMLNWPDLKALQSEKN